MDRINSANFITVGGKRQFQNKNLGAGIPGTTLDAPWFTGVQEEVLKTIETGGGLTANAADNTQLYQSILTMIANGGSNNLAAGWQIFPGVSGQRLMLLVGTSLVTAGGAGITTLDVTLAATPAAIIRSFGDWDGTAPPASGGVTVSPLSSSTIRIYVNAPGAGPYAVSWTVLGRI